MAKNGDAEEKDWQKIEKRLKEIANMKQSAPGYVWEVMTYGQGSLTEKKGLALGSLAYELADRFGYEIRKTWGDVFDGRIGHVERKR